MPNEEWLSTKQTARCLLLSCNSDRVHSVPAISPLSAVACCRGRAAAKPRRADWSEELLRGCGHHRSGPG